MWPTPEEAHADALLAALRKRAARRAPRASWRGAPSAPLPALAAPSSPPTAWRVADVCAWLAAAVELPQYAPAFRDASVDGPLLLTLGAADLARGVGVAHPLHARKLLAAIARLRGGGAELEGRVRPATDGPGEPPALAPAPACAPITAGAAATAGLQLGGHAEARLPALLLLQQLQPVPPARQAPVAPAPVDIPGRSPATRTVPLPAPAAAAAPVNVSKQNLPVLLSSATSSKTTRAEMDVGAHDQTVSRSQMLQRLQLQPTRVGVGQLAL